MKIVEATGCRNILVSDALSHTQSYSTLGRSLYHLQDIGSGQVSEVPSTGKLREEVGVRRVTWHATLPTTVV